MKVKKLVRQRKREMKNIQPQLHGNEVENMTKKARAREYKFLFTLCIAVGFGVRAIKALTPIKPKLLRKSQFFF